MSKQYGEQELLNRTFGIRTFAHTEVSVGASTTKILDANTSRKYALVINDSDAVIYIKVGVAAEMNKGIRINANGGWYEMSLALGNCPTGQINAISQAGSKLALLVEGV